jgi:uncharacterized protein
MAPPMTRGKTRWGAPPTTVTVAVTRVIHPGKEAEFARWATRADEALAQAPGYLAAARLQDSHGLNHLVYHFDSPAHLHAWEQSPRRDALLAEGAKHSDHHRTPTGGVPAWFTVAGQRAWPKWKNFLLTWAAVYPTLALISVALTAVAQHLPRELTLAAGSVVLVAALSWLILPIATRRARRWLFRHARPQAQRPPPP